MKTPKWIEQRLELVTERRSYPLAGDPRHYRYRETDKKPCDDCGKLVLDRRIESRKVFSPCVHWKNKCVACDKIRNPRTGEWDLEPHTSHYHFKTWLEEINNKEHNKNC